MLKIIKTTLDTMERIDTAEHEEQRVEREISERESEENQAAQNGVTDDKETLQRKLEQLQALYENTKHELDSTREALGKIQSSQPGASSSSVETKERSSETHSQDTAEQEAKATSTRRTTFKIFVGNLSDYATSSDIRNLFEIYGTVEEADVLKNYGFVHMKSEDEGEAAIRALDGYMLHGKPLDVKASTGIRKGAVDQGGGLANTESSGQKNTFKIFVGNLSDFATSADIREIFENYGTVVEADVMKNYGFVHMKNEEEGQAAIKALNGHRLRGKPMVAEASTGTRKSGYRMPKIFVGNLSRHCTRDELKNMFEEYGKVVEIGMLTNFAFVHMSDESDAQKAIRELDGHEMHGLRLTVQKATSRGRQQYGMGYPDMGSRYLPGDRLGWSLGSRYDPYPPPPPHRYGRERIMSQRDMYDSRLPPLPPPPNYIEYGRLLTPSRYSLPSSSLHGYNPSDRRPY